MAGKKVVATNRQARFKYFVFDKYEAGVELKGSEVKSIRNGRVNLRDSFARFRNGEAWLCNAHITPYAQADVTDVQSPTRERKLLLKKREIEQLTGSVSRKGYACVPLTIYFKRGLVKVEIALCQGKKAFDKREAIKEREHAREIDRARGLRQKRG